MSFTDPDIARIMASPQLLVEWMQQQAGKPQSPNAQWAAPVPTHPPPLPSALPIAQQSPVVVQCLIRVEAEFSAFVFEGIQHDPQQVLSYIWTALTDPNWDGYRPAVKYSRPEALQVGGTIHAPAETIEARTNRRAEHGGDDRGVGRSSGLVRSGGRRPRPSAAKPRRKPGGAGRSADDAPHQSPDGGTGDRD